MPPGTHDQDGRATVKKPALRRVVLNPRHCRGMVLLLMLLF